MRKIGMFYGSRVRMLEQFEKHVNAVSGPHFGNDVKVCGRTMTITVGNYKYMYYAFEREGSALTKIAGIEFDAMFSEDLNEHCKRYVLSRFRPRFDK